MNRLTFTIPATDIAGEGVKVIWRAAFIEGGLKVI
jgi:hypothetical protein